MNKLNIEDPLITIAIPLYNGEETLGSTLESILSQISKNVDIVLCDDNSSDKTLQIATNFSDKYDFIKVYKNNNNIGMDRNFLRTAKLSKGNYIWFFGQDDELYDGAIDRVVSILTDNSDIGILYLNYDQYDHNMENVINSSYLKIDKEKSKFFLVDKASYKFVDTNDYFRVVPDIPSFLPATIIKNEYWQSTDLNQFFDTYYIQVGLMYLNMHKDSIYVVSDSFIKGRIPINKWQHDGLKHFEILTGFLVMQKKAISSGSSIPKKLYNKYRYDYLLNYFFHIFLCKKRGFEPTLKHESILKYIYNRNIIFKMYLKPILYLSLPVLNKINFLLLPLKKSILKLIKLLKILTFDYSKKVKNVNEQ